MADDHELKADGDDSRDGVGHNNFTTNSVSSGEVGTCLVVGIGASAGGLEPLERIFTALPADCNLSFVVVMHLHAEGPSFLADFLRRYTAMEVMPAEDGMRLRPNTVIVIPPGRDLLVEDHMVRFAMPAGMGAMKHPIDRFLISLAEEKGKGAIAVILSGFGLDGANGVKRVREKGGIVIVQKPETTVYSAMPRGAIATNAVDFILPVDEIPSKISQIARGECSLPNRSCLATTLDQELADIFSAVKERTGHDFSAYKRSTVLRRIERRMTVNESGGLRKYLAFLEQDSHEAQALAREILIGVTKFFRDPVAFERLREEILPKLFTGRNPKDPVRIWHACCATGEEVYSTAMLIREYLDAEKQDAGVRIFATDIDERAVAHARAGLYASDIVEEIGDDRLKRFFSRSDGQWQVAKQLREMILFAHHSIIKDAPFSRLDLLVCRNFLIYLDADMQKRLIALFHMVLKPGGILFLGTSESVDRNTDLFAPVDKKWKIFRRKEGGRSEDALFPFNSTVHKISIARHSKTRVEAPKLSPGAMAERILIERYSPPCVVVNEKYEVLHVSSRTRRYLEVPVGEPTMDLLRMAGEVLRPALRAAIYKSFEENRQVAFRGVKVHDDSGESLVNVLAEPLPADPAYGKLALVILEPASPSAVVTRAPDGKTPAEDKISDQMLIRQLEEQLRVTHEQLKYSTEQLGTSNEGFVAANEELMSINEEFQSTNEELQSTNEELETSKEELHALNEELMTVNAELQGKVEELDQANSDMVNLFASSEIATVFLDRDLAIKRFSPAMGRLLNLIPADIGRPFRHLAGTIHGFDLPEDARSVLDNHAFVEREVTSPEDGRCFIMRVLPYRTGDETVDGIVVTLVDISRLKQAEGTTRSVARFPLENPAPVMRVKGDGAVLFANRAAESLTAHWREESGSEVLAPLLECIVEALADGKSREYEAEDAGRWISFAVVPISGRNYVNLYGRDITERKQAQETVIQAKKEWERTFDSVPDLIAILDKDHHILRVNRAMAGRLGVTPDKCVGAHCYQCVHGSDNPPGFCPHALTLADGMEHEAEIHEAHLGGDFLVSTTPLFDTKGELFGAVHMARDITERKKMENALRESESFYRQTLESIPGMVFTTLPDGYCDFQSRQWEEFTGVPVSEHLGDGWNRLLHTEDRPRAFAAWRDAVEGRAPYDLEYRVRRHDGVYEWFRVIGRPIRDENGRIDRWFGVAINIENLIRAETALKQSNSELEDTNRELESFIYSASHDLRGPLRSIAGFGGILKTRYGEQLKGQGIDYLSRICNGAEKMSSLIDDLLRLSKISKQEIDRKQVDLSRMASGIIDELKDSRPDRDVSVDIEPGLIADADQRLLEMLLSNLLRNAWKFTGKKEKALIRFDAVQQDGKTVFCVKDNGAGFNPEYRERMFLPFHRLHTNEEFEGTGIGLAIVHRIIHRHGGRVWAEGEEGTGASIFFTLD